MREASGTEHRQVTGIVTKSCARPTGAVMVSPPEAPRNAEGLQSEGRVGGGRPSTPVQRGQQCKHYKGRDTP